MRNARKLAGLCVVSAAGALLIWTACSAHAQRSGDVRQIRIGNVVRLKARISSAPANTNDKDVLVESDGGADELPDGPTGFTVLPDGSFAVTDPLQKRVVVFNSSGAFRSEWKIGYSADSLTLTGGVVRARNAATGNEDFFDLEGRFKGRAEGQVTSLGEARLISATRGSINVPLSGSGALMLDVVFEQPGMRLASLQSLGTDRQGNSYLAMEVTPGGEEIEVNKIVRKYARSVLAAEIRDISLDYYVHPVDEFRVERGVVYQLMPLRSEVRINSWNTNN